MMKEKPNATVRESTAPAIWDVEDLASATECTGLVPAAIQTPEEAEDYASLYAIHQQKTAWTKERDGKPPLRGENG